MPSEYLKLMLNFTLLLGFSPLNHQNENKNNTISLYFPWLNLQDFTIREEENKREYMQYKQSGLKYTILILDCSINTQRLSHLHAYFSYSTIFKCLLYSKGMRNTSILCSVQTSTLEPQRVGTTLVTYTISFIQSTQILPFQFWFLQRHSSLQRLKEKHLTLQMKPSSLPKTPGLWFYL